MLESCAVDRLSLFVYFSLCVFTRNRQYQDTLYTSNLVRVPSRSMSLAPSRGSFSFG